MARGWCCFKFWCCYRLLTAFVTHLNLVNALYVNCAYFTLWKAYDILWFWMHAILCACIPAVRPDNFFVVSCTLIWKKRTKYPKRSYMEIYDLLYNFKRAELQNLVSSDSSQRVPEASALSYAPSSDESDPDEMHNESVERGRSLSASIMKKRLRKEQKKEARGIERKRQNISHAVELLLQSLRLKISYAIIMGNLVRILAQFKKELPESSTEESIHVMVISTYEMICLKFI
ncbi:hypothetical protein QR680_007971 [Steinernema hermaphroditum]|uniref:Uncharacterized protein n=1 Tax=Steinernema hermaphroditum TaxID=289476 RepID=A0AA39IGF6_9BILA|nr:hypothetical protein QR680_007971 [Steinernema hermaphroditum]